MNTAAAGQLICTPHPVTLEGQRHFAMDLCPGERLGEFLRRHIPDIDEGEWVVSQNGRPVAKPLWARVFPKDGTVIEVRQKVGKQALYIVAMVALTYFTMGIGTAGGAFGTWAGATFGAVGGALVTAGVFVAGPAIGGRCIA